MNTEFEMTDYPEMDNIGVWWDSEGFTDQDFIDMIDFIVEAEIAMRGLAIPRSRHHFLHTTVPGGYVDADEAPGFELSQKHPGLRIILINAILGGSFTEIRTNGPFYWREGKQFGMIGKRHWNFAGYDFSEFNKSTPPKKYRL